MPLSDDLLAPISVENPSGPDLYYDAVFENIKEARREEEDDLPEGDWQRSKKKKADHRLVSKLTVEALAKRSKDLRLAAWLVESHLRVDGLPTLVPGIDLLRALQEKFWTTIHPEIEEGDDLVLRAIAIEAAAKGLALALRKLHLTQSGLTLEDYFDSCSFGYEKDATTDAKKAARKTALDRGQLSAEAFDKALSDTPLSFYVEAGESLAGAVEATAKLKTFQQEKYTQRPPSLAALESGLEEVAQVLEKLLAARQAVEEKRAAERSAREQERAENEKGSQTARPAAVKQVRQPAAPAPEIGCKVPTQKPREVQGESESESRAEIRGVEPAFFQDPFGLIVRSAEIFFDRDPASPVPYLVCSGLRFGETRMQAASPEPGFAVGPTPQIRSAIRVLAAQESWQDLLRAALPILATECARAWLDLHRYIWRAARETGAEALAEAVVGNVKSLLAVRPELRHWTLEDDTGAANPETQHWIDAVVLN